MGEFLKTWYGMTLFILFDAAAIVAVMAIGYRWIFKRLWDLAASVVSMAVLSPLYLAIFIRAKLFQKRTGAMKSILSREFFVGKKAKTIVLHTFCIVDDDGDEAGGYGHWLKKTGLYKLPYIFDVFCGKLSFIGVKRLSFADAAFVSEADEGRYAVRAGLINPLVTTGNGETDYKEMFSSDLSYAKSLSLFGDLKIFFVWLLKKIRGEKNTWLGATASRTYAESLLGQGEITREDFDTVAENARAEEEELRKKYEIEESAKESPQEENLEGEGGENASDERELPQDVPSAADAENADEKKE